MYTIKFADGSELKNITINGNNFISPEEVTAEYFTPEKLAHVEITPDNDELMSSLCGTFDNMTLMHCTHYKDYPGFDDGYYFVLKA